MKVLLALLLTAVITFSAGFLLAVFLAADGMAKYRRSAEATALFLDACTEEKELWKKSYQEMMARRLERFEPL